MTAARNGIGAVRVTEKDKATHLRDARFHLAHAARSLKAAGMERAAVVALGLRRRV